jgi:serine/threonine protein kinase
MTASVGSVLGDYRLEAVLGASPAAVVYRAAHVRLGTPAAVKVLSPVAGEDEQGRERFLARVTATAGIDHPTVIPILDAGVHEDEPYIVMRFVGGGDLKALVARTGALDPALAMTILAPVGEALDAAHAQGVVHGGVKPSNVLLRWSRDGTVQQVYLSDFGMAERMPSTEGLSSVGPLVDRFDYLAPEQVEDDEVGPPADVYALGCVLFHALTGRAPFGGRFGGAVLHGRDAEGVERPSAVRAGLPTGVDDPILRAMEEEPRRRFATAGELTSAVALALDDAGMPAAEHTLPSAEMGPPAAVEPPPVQEPPARAPSERPVRPVADRPLVTEPDRTLDSAPVAQAERTVDPPFATEADPAPEPPLRAPSEPPRRESEVPPAPVTAEPPPASDEPPRSRRRLLTVTIPVVLCTIAAGVLGFIIASGGDNGSDDGATATTPGQAATPGTSAAEPLRAIADRRLSSMRCTVSDAGGGAEVAGTASCTPQGGGSGQPRRVSLTLLTTREALDDFFRRTRALAAGGTGGAGGAAGCPSGPWTSPGGGAGRVFCAGGGTPRVVWTVDDALVLADASGRRQGQLVTWWQQQRDLRPQGRQG